jgi:hypothetical protein
MCHGTATGTMAHMTAAQTTLEWLSSPDNPPVRYLTARDLLHPRPSAATLDELRADVLSWPRLRALLALQREDGSFPGRTTARTAQPTFQALSLLQRCGLTIRDAPVARAVEHLDSRHCTAGALSHNGGGSGVLPCYCGIVAATLIQLGGLDTRIVQETLQWLVDHQRFDHKDHRAGGAEPWRFRALVNYGCWSTVSCYHGAVGAFRAFAAVPQDRRCDAVRARLDEAVEYLRRHRGYRRTRDGRPLFRHMTTLFLVGDYRSDLLDVLQALADADPSLACEEWVQDAMADLDALVDDGRLTVTRTYDGALAEPVELEEPGTPSRFLTYQWLVLLGGSPTMPDMRSTRPRR